ncbi:mannose-6-phosphate isomerase-like protein (cupin superfamily) [Amycolatopsis echigonensis]|uniref:Mannose-6-phosphate isomerase-like protein (Cupin superfamily) n=1 Tax=Amycolatopsis echigonensis TaxID=2576905 RepID=A0A2N3X1D3_9PSEU|nr:cupin domain-containing protein [Amycolatopsis niigatensis]PKV99918.1 mannose-6-phosphate isomerase-like protein (cupin superfamily) [Amycolatopsis niigatensis]
MPNAPTVTVFFGGEEGGPDVGLVRVRIPVGTSLPHHTHGGSDVILAPIAGLIRISTDDESIDAHPGDSVLVRKDDEVSLANPGEVEAQVIVAAGPPNFVGGIRQWPEPPA